MGSWACVRLPWWPVEGLSSLGCRAPRGPQGLSPGCQVPARTRHAVCVRCHRLDGVGWGRKGGGEVEAPTRREAVMASGECVLHVALMVT